MYGSGRHSLHLSVISSHVPVFFTLSGPVIRPTTVIIYIITIYLYGKWHVFHVSRGTALVSAVVCACAAIHYTHSSHVSA